MFETDSRSSFVSKQTLTSYTKSPYAQFQHRDSPVGDIRSYISKAQSTTDAKAKFEKIAEIVKEFPVTVELTKFFTELLAEIFGFGNYQGWRLNSLNGRIRNDEILFKEVEKFLNPTGKLFQLIDKLVNENVTFDLPSALLPGHISESILSDTSSFFHGQKSGFAAGNQMLPARKLNALEYYLFIFFSYIMQPNIRKESMDWNGDVLYISLFETYLAYFLPLELTQAQEPKSQLASPRITSPPSNEFYTKFGGTSSRSHCKVDVNSFIANFGLRPLHSGSWKSEIFAQIFSDLWLASGRQFSTRGIYAQDYYLPTDDQVILVRIFIKHMHTFLNGKGSPYSSSSTTYSASSAGQEDELKGAIVSIVQKKLYLFLKNCFAHWPLGASFKMVLETWLSYIQPWRYQTQSNLENTGQDGTTDLSSWSVFIEHSLLFYTVLFRMFMVRAMRLDLQAVKDVEFICRVSKVFSQANLAELLQEAEESLFTPSSQSRINHLSTQRLGSIYTAFQFPHKGTDLEDTGFEYEPLFDPLFVQQMEGLAQQIADEEQKVKDQIARRSMKSVDKSFMGQIRTFFSSGSEDEDASQDEKLEGRLNMVCNQLARIFKFAPPEPSEAAMMSVDGRHNVQLPRPFVASHYYEDGRLLPEYTIEDDGKVTLTDRGRWQILQKMRHFDVQGKAAVDLEPIRSYEIPSVVRWLYRLSSRINEKYREQLMSSYNSENIVGKTLRTLSPKLFEHRGTSVRLPCSAATERVQPKISLRFLGSYYTIYYILWLLIIAILFDIGILQFVFMLLLLFVVFTLQNVVSSPVKLE